MQEDIGKEEEINNNQIEQVSEQKKKKKKKKKNKEQVEESEQMPEVQQAEKPQEIQSSENKEENKQQKEEEKKENCDLKQATQENKQQEEEKENCDLNEETQENKKKKKKKKKKNKENQLEELDEISKNNQETQEENQENKKKKKKKKKKDYENEEEQKIEFKDPGPLYNPNFSDHRNRLDPLPELTKNRLQDNSIIRNLGSWAEGSWGQTNPPTIPIDIQFPKKDFPFGIVHQYTGSNSWRNANEEMKEKDKIDFDTLQSLRKAAECQRQVRKWAQCIIRPGKRLIDICEEIEELNRFLIQENGIEQGIAFPTGCSLNHVAAHYSPNNGDFQTIEYDDVCKIDFGTQVNGFIIDTAFTVAFNPQYDKLLEAAKDATNSGINAAGIDARFSDIGAVIEETMQSYECEIKGKMYPVQIVRNLQGHQIDQYKIHGGKSVPCIKHNSGNQKMEEGEQYAIETFGVINGKGNVYEQGDCSHYMKDFEKGYVQQKNLKAKNLMKFIDQNFDTLAFCRRWLDRGGQIGHLIALKSLCDQGVINAYPPLCDVRGSYVAQYEHTLFLKPSGKEVLSRGDDY